MKMNETWLPVKGYEGKYEVSDLGRVRSLNYNREGKTNLMSPCSCRGYLFVFLSKNGKKKRFYVHRLVVTAFIGPIPKGMQVNHKNEDKRDNRLENLEIVTPKQNVNHGTRNERASKVLKGRKLTEEWKRKISEAQMKQLDLIEAEYPYREYTFPSSLIASEFFNYKAKNQVTAYIYKARKRGENFINLKGNKYFFSQEA